jgi:hypothetical protein
LFMAASRTALLKLFPNYDLGMISLLVTASGVVGPIILFWLTRNTKLSFLFKRPEWAKLAKTLERWHTPSYVKQLNVKTR